MKDNIQHKKIKVVHVINTLLVGGAEKLLTNMLPLFKQHNLDVELICLRNDFDQNNVEILQNNNIKIHYLTSRYSIYNPILIYLLFQKLKEINPTFIHSHIFPTFYWVGFSKLIFRYKYPLFHTEHDTSNRRMRNKFWAFVDQMVYKQFDEIICISKGVEHVLKKYVPFMKTTTIYNGIPLNEFYFKKTYCSNDHLFDLITQIKAQPNSKIVLTIGRLVEKKNQQLMIKIINELPKNVYLLIAGDGNLKVTLQENIDDLSLDKRVFLLGNQSDVPYLIQQCDLGILTSTIEGFGLASVEMAAGGLPVVSSNISGLNEVCADPSLLCSPLEINDFKTVINKLLNNVSYYEEMKRKGVEKSAHFKIETMAKNYSEFYKSRLFKFDEEAKTKA